MKAFDIATRDLRACYGEHGIYAGLHHFKDYWARDSFFASFGSLKLKDYEIVKKNLELFAKNISKTGQIPIRIGKKKLGIVLSYFGINKGKRVAIYREDKKGHIPVDQNSLFLIAAYEYFRETKDKEFQKKYKETFERAIRWNFLMDKDKDNLIEEAEYSNWADSIKKKGKVLYTNVCHCHALKCAYHLTGVKKYKGLYKDVKAKINRLFWSGEHYIDWIDKDKHYSYFAPDGNILAVLWDIADKTKSKHIEEAIHIISHPQYPRELISAQTRLLGLVDYHNGLRWIWLDSLHALAKHKAGMEKEADEILEQLSSLIEKHGAVYEIYEGDKPVKRTIYTAEHPFAWSAGLYIYAISEAKSEG